MSKHFRSLLLLGAVLLPATLFAAGCGSAWKSIPPSSVGEDTQNLGGEYGRFVMNDQRVIEMRIVAMKYPWVDGHRVLGRWSTRRTVRVDLRQVSRIEVRNES